MGLRYCKNCQETKSVSEFFQNKTVKDGISNVCRPCKRIRDGKLREKNREAFRESGRRWRSNNPERARELSRASCRKLRTEVLSAYGGRCACCNEMDPVFLTIDHINGGGTAHRKAVHGNVYAQLRREGFPSGFRVLCWNCNWAFAANGFCPHSKARCDEV